MKPDLDRRSKLAFGVAALCVVFALESVVAHQTAPSPASPFVWTVLAVVGLGALAYGAWCRHRLRRDPSDPTPPPR